VSGLAGNYNMTSLRHRTATNKQTHAGINNTRKSLTQVRMHTQNKRFQTKFDFFWILKPIIARMFFVFA